MKRNYNPKLLTDEELINEYYHVRVDVEAYGVSSDVALLPELKKELLKRIKELTKARAEGRIQGLKEAIESLPEELLVIRSESNNEWIFHHGYNLALSESQQNIEKLLP